MFTGRKQSRLSTTLTLLGLCVLINGCNSRAKTLYSPPGSQIMTNAPAVRLMLPADGTTFHAHTDIRLLALATPHGTDLGPEDSTGKVWTASEWQLVGDQEDGYSVGFLAGTNHLSSQSASMVSARVKPRPGYVTPMIMIAVGYPAQEWIWHDVPAGSYTLTANCTNGRGQSTISKPVTITVLP